MEGKLEFGNKGVRLDLQFATLDELQWFIQNMIAGPANKFGYEVQLVEMKNKPKPGNVGVV